ncbi:hypothetical protein PHET_07194 [Paragonimus heterotremus]|uniref:Centrosomal protein of 19 kDa n=1 Tax=Paragonimus heterotremus TaxID=100268 RepID=A0A8J4T6B2_9TREM|nr:hypothetical protein PHET_07194 [Paragonimus heterotremus]
MDTRQIYIRRCGIKCEPPTLVIVYHVGLKTRKRAISVRDIHQKSVSELFQDILKKSQDPIVQNIPKVQLLRLLTILKDLVNGVSLKESIERCKTVETISTEEDLNLVDVDVLERKKALMDQQFEQNRISPTDPTFQYDKKVDFPQDHVETSAWDSDEFEI